MFNEKAFKRAIEDAGLSMEEVAQLLNINVVTLYRKINGESDFYRKEIQKISSVIGKDRIMEIFFASKVA